MSNGTLTCPGCQTPLRTAKPLPPGARLKCPKCQTVFATPSAPAAPATPAAAGPPQDPYAAPPPARPKPPPAADPYGDTPPAKKPAPAAAARSRPNGGRAGRVADPDAGPADAAAPPKKTGVPVWVWLAAGGGAFLLLCVCPCSVGTYMWYAGANWLSNLPSVSSSDKVTMENYDKIKKDMSEADVKAILGEPFFSTDDSFMGGTRLSKGQKCLVWSGRSEDGISVVFEKDKAIHKKCSIDGKDKEQPLR
jgi:LSD1 subclass zinc finger protein